MENQKIPDEQRCNRRTGNQWRCKNLVSRAHNPSYYCDKHYNSAWYQEKLLIKIRGRKRGRPAKHHHSSEIEIGFKRQTTEKTDNLLMKASSKELELRSLEDEEETQKCEVKLERILGVCKIKCVELLEELEKKTKECIEIQGKLAELESMKIAAEEELEEFKRTQEKKRNLDGIVWGRKEERTCGRVLYLEAELKKMEKDKKREKRVAQGEVEFWRSKVFDLEARVSRMENGSVESRISEPRGLQDDAPRYGKREVDNEVSKRDAAFGGGRHCSRVSGLKSKDKVVNDHEVEDGAAECTAMSIYSKSPKVLCGGQNAKDGGNGRVERASVYEFSSGNDSESLGEVMDRTAMKYNNKVKEIKWEFEDDMLSSFEEDPDVCMKAICALYRLQIQEGKSAQGLFHDFDAFRIRNLAEFLMEGNPKGDLKKSVKELEEEFTSKALEDCKRLASSYSKQLFSIYKDKQDQFFLSTSTASC